MATISVKGLPQTLTPSYNPSVWYFDSTLKANAGYRYLVKIYSAATILLATYRFLPRPGDGYAVVDLTKLLKNFVSFDKDIPTGVDQIPNSWFGYYVTVQDEYNTDYTYDDFTWYAGNITNLASNVTADTHTFNPGDQILVNQTDGGVEKPGIQGIHTVIAPTISGTSDLYTDIDFAVIGSGAAMGGTVTFADNRKTVSAVEFNSNGAKNYIFNGSIPFELFPTYDMTDYTIDSASTTHKLLTSMPRPVTGGFYITPTQDVLINFANNFATNRTVFILTSDGDWFTEIYSTTTATEPIMRANISPSNTNYTVVMGNAPLLKSTTTYYDVWIVDDSLTQQSEKLRFYIDRRCVIQDAEILFMDRMGSFNSFAFQLRNTNINKNEKSKYKRLAGDLGVKGDGNPGYAYSLNDSGETVFNVDISTTIELNTNWMDDAASIYFQELVSSPVTYLKQNSVYQSVTIINSTVEEKRQVDKTLIRYTITVALSNNSTINI